ncbi:GNAT family N-acetyltransferase [Salipiger sp. H15]|uniref:GNAT family N-acetyltransferase n=1 Tax=Alloyangia sp. H15 TaxID=3029062 RepID=A0AAU8AHF0_9RHOB
MFTPCDSTDIPALAGMLRGLGPTGEAGLRDDLAAAMDAGAQLRAYRVGGVPRGYLVWRWQGGEGPRRAVLEHIWVEPSWRRRGVARRLIAGFEAEIAGQGAQGWITRVEAANAPSRALMLGAGAIGAVEVLEKRLQAPA